MKGNTAAEPPQNPPWYYGQGRLYPVGLLCFSIVLVFIAIREAHKDDTDSAPDGSNAMKLIKDAKKALAVPGSYLDVFEQNETEIEKCRCLGFVHATAF